MLKPGNEAPLDRLLRIASGGLMLGLAWSGGIGGLSRLALEIFAWVPLVTGLVGWCPFYAIFGFSTRRKGPRPKVR